MTAHVVYVVTSEGRDIYSIMTRLSVASQRISNRHVRIRVVCDPQSANAMQHKRDPLLTDVDELLTFEVPAGSAAFRNRFLKTKLRNLIDGPYLFMDSDTLVRRDLSGLFVLAADIACAANHSNDHLEGQIWDEDKAALATMAWQTRNDVYVNGGLMLCNDTDGARRFAAEWHRRWLASAKRLERHRFRDQPALNAAIFATGVNLEVLPHAFNAQIKIAPESAADAAVWHFYSATESKPITTFELLRERVLNGADFTTAEIALMVRQPHPWRRRSWVDDFAAERVSRTRCLDESDYSWFQGRRLRSVMCRIRSAVRARRPRPRRTP